MKINRKSPDNVSGLSRYKNPYKIKGQGRNNKKAFKSLSLRQIADVQTDFGDFFL